MDVKYTRNKLKIHLKYSQFQIIWQKHKSNLAKIDHLVCTWLYSIGPPFDLHPTTKTNSRNNVFIQKLTKYLTVSLLQKLPRDFTLYFPPWGKKAQPLPASSLPFKRWIYWLFQVEMAANAMWLLLLESQGGKWKALLGLLTLPIKLAGIERLHSKQPPFLWQFPSLLTANCGPTLKLFFKETNKQNPYATEVSLWGWPQKTLR